MSRRMIHCVVYSHVWSLFRLDAIAALGSMEKAAVVELAVNSNLAAAFIDGAKNRLGLGGLLRRNVALQDIVETVEDLAWPVAFASRPPIPIGALSSAVGLLASAEGRFDKIILMVHILEAAQLQAAMTAADRYHVVWDLADAPTRALAQVGEALAAQRVLGPAHWGGFHLYTDPRRPVENEAQSRQNFESVIGQYPDLLAAQPSA